jgi:hypothetical protein
VGESCCLERSFRDYLEKDCCISLFSKGTRGGLHSWALGNLDSL